MSYHHLDMELYKRRDHFRYFSSLAYPYTGITVNVDVTEFAREIKAKGLPFFLSFCYCVSRAANGIPEFRQRILNDGIIEFDSCKTSHTVALEDGTYCYCSLDSNLPFSEYLPYAVHTQEEARKARSMEDEGEEASGLIFISTLPWVAYTSLVQPVPMPADSNPRITWGRYFTQADRFWMPVSVLCNHALADGLHMAQFYENLEYQIKSLLQVLVQ